uniref:Uncharacterized protein n=1 Tax=Anguilla anguilla TaxID=7936 RepID=A0A0E9VI89_ANGAN
MCGLIAARLHVELSYYTLVGNKQLFEHLWGVNRVLCQCG